MRKPTPIQGRRALGNARLCVRKAALLMGFAALGLLPAVPLTGCDRSPAVVLHAARGAVTVPVEVADTPDKRATGLMYRRDLAPDAGMLFLFTKASPQKFWMKNTPLPLDMIFIGPTAKIVGIVADACPFTTNPLGPDEPSRYVLEVNAGFAAKHGLAVGDQVEFVRVHSIAGE